MGDFIASRIIQNYHFKFPDGLKELMSDVSREVLRAQPQNIYSFIADYFSALLVIREHLNIASRICTCLTEKELDEMLRDMGLGEDAIATAVAIVTQYLDTPNMKETKVLSKVTRRVQIKDHQIQLVLDAMRAARLQHTVRKENITRKLFKDETEAAVQYTLDLYKQTKPSDEEYIQMEQRIKASYEAYGVKREISESTSSSSSDILFYPWFNQQQSSLDFSSSDDEDSNDESAKMLYKDQEVKLDVSTNKIEHSKKHVGSVHKFIQNKISFKRNTQDDTMIDKGIRQGVVTFCDASSDSDVINTSEDEVPVEEAIEVYKSVNATSMYDDDDIEGVDHSPDEEY